LHGTPLGCNTSPPRRRSPFSMKTSSSSESSNQLFDAIANRDIDAVRSLLAGDPELCLDTQEAETPLHVAAGMG